MKHLISFLAFNLTVSCIAVQAQYMNSKKSYDPTSPDNKILIVPPTEHDIIDLETFSGYVEKFWGDVLEYEFVTDLKDAEKRAKKDDKLLVGSFYGYYTSVNLQRSFRPSIVFEINKSDFRIRTFLSSEMNEADFTFALKHAAYLYRNRAFELKELYTQNGHKLKEKKVLISVDQMIERTEKKRNKYLSKIIDAYPYEIEKVSMNKIHEAIINEPEGILVAMKATVEDPTDKSSGTTNYYFIYDPTDGSVISSSRVVFHPKTLLKNVGL